MWRAFLVKCTVSITHGAQFCRVCVSFCVCVGPKGRVYSEQGHLGSSEMGGCRMEGLLMCWGVTEVLIE